jgi:sec-independent protein translocase protein TatB
MFDMGFTEMLLIGIVALVVIGPERLPGVARTAGKYLGKLKRFMTTVRADVESELRTDELREILAKQQEELNSLKDVVSDTAKDLDISADVLGDTAQNLNESLQTPSADDFHSEAHSVEPETTQAAKSEPVAKSKTRTATSVKSRVKSKPATRVKAKAKAGPRAKAKTKTKTKKQAS